MYPYTSWSIGFDHREFETLPATSRVDHPQNIGIGYQAMFSRLVYRSTG